MKRCVQYLKRGVATLEKRCPTLEKSCPKLEKKFPKLEKRMGNPSQNKARKKPDFWVEHCMQDRILSLEYRNKKILSGVHKILKGFTIVKFMGAQKEC